MKCHKPAVLLSAVVFIFSGCFIDPSASAGMQKSREGDGFFSAGDFDRAVEKWTESLDYKNNAAVYEKIVMVQIMKNDLDGAEKWTQKGLTCFPDNVNLSFNLALIKYQKEDFDGASDNLERVLGINRYYPNAHYLKGLIYEKKGDLASARKEFVNEVNINPGSKAAWQKLRGLKND